MAQPEGVGKGVKLRGPSVVVTMENMAALRLPDSNPIRKTGPVATESTVE